MKQFKIFLFALAAFGLMLTQACKDDDPGALAIASIVANGTDLMTGSATSVDLNGTTSATDVPLDAVITVTFDKAVDASTVNSTSVSLSSGSNAVSASVSAVGSAITVTPDADFERGKDYTLSLAATIKADDGGSFTAITRTFTAAGRADVVPPQEANQVGYWPFNGNANSSDGTQNGVETGVSYGVDRLGNVGSAAAFDGDVSLIEIPNGDQLLNPSTTVSYWIMIDTNGHYNVAGNGLAGHFVLGIGNTSGGFSEIFGSLSGMKMTWRYERMDGTTVANDFFFNGDGMDANNGGWVGVEYEVDLTGSGGLGALLQGKWAHLVWVYDAAVNKRHLYINGTLMETDNLGNTTGLADLVGLKFDDSGAGTDVIGKALAIGFVHDRTTTTWSDTDWGDYAKPGANHFKGMFDDLRVWKVALTASEVMELYNKEK